MSSEKATIHIDGASRGNPGPAAYAYVIAVSGKPVIEVAERLGRVTNNVAEYTALVRALAAAREEGIRKLEVFSDSELLVKQMSGAYRVKKEELKALYEEAQDLVDHFDKVEVRHVRRSLNKRADELCNLVLDGKWGAGGATPSSASLPSDDRVRDDAVACLTAAANEWADKGIKVLPPEQVWDQLWSILQEGGVLKQGRRSG